MPTLEIIKSEANKPNVNSVFPKRIWLRSPLLSASLVAHLGWINRKALRQPLSVASLTTWLLSSVCSRAWCYISWQCLEGSFYIHQGSGAEQRALYLCKEMHQGSGSRPGPRSHSGDHTESVPSDKQAVEAPEFSLMSLKQSFQPGYLPKQMVHTLASVIKKSQLSTHRTADFKLHNFLVPLQEK